MPRVPQYQPGQVGPVQTTNARIRATDNPGGLGILAEGLNGAAKLAGQYDQSELQNDEAQQRRVAAEARLAYAAAGDGFTEQKLAQARDGEKPFISELDKIKSDFVGQGRSARARQLIEQALLPIDGETRLRAAQHAASESRSEQKASFGFEQSAIMDNAVSIGVENPAAKDRLGLQLRDSVRNQLAFEGFDEKTAPQVFAQAEKSALSKMHEGIVDKLFTNADSRTDEIIAYRAAYQDEMTSDLSNDIMRRLQGPLQDRLATSDTAAVLAIYQGEAPEKAANAGTATSYLDRVRKQESGGSDTAKNPRSSATGRYQFTDGTWLASYRKRYGGGSMSDRQILAKRSDPAIQEALMQDFTNDNTKVLQDAGLPVNGGTLYLAHFAGPAGARQLLKADRGASVASVLSPKAMASNPFMKNWSVGALVDWAGGVGGQEAVPNAPVERDPVKLNQAIDQWAKATGASPERVQRTRQAVQAHARTDESLLKDREQDAGEKARVFALQSGDAFKFSGLPKEVRENLSPVDRAEYQSAERRLAEARTKKDTEARGQSVLWTLQRMQRYEPEKFKQEKLERYVGVIPAESLNALDMKQTDMVTKREKRLSETDYRGWITEEINFQKNHNGRTFTPQQEVALFDFMSSGLSDVQKKAGAVLTKQVVASVFQAGMKQMPHSSGWLGMSTKPTYEISADVPEDWAADFIANDWRSRTPPTKAELISAYRRDLISSGNK